MVVIGLTLHASRTVFKRRILSAGQCGGVHRGPLKRSGRRGGSTLGPAGTGPQIFWFQQQKYALLKSRLFFVQCRNQHSYQLVHKQ